MGTLETWIETKHNGPKVERIEHLTKEFEGSVTHFYCYALKRSKPDRSTRRNSIDQLFQWLKVVAGSA